MHRSRRQGSTRSLDLLLLPLLLLGTAPAVSAQTASVRTQENFRAEPNGTIVGQVMPGTMLGVVGRQGRWVEATLEGWVWLPSLQRRDGGAFDLSVSASGGENVRAEPQGRIVARLEQGTLLEEVERITGWIRVRRTAWIWDGSVAVQAPPPPAPVRAPAPAAPEAPTPPAAAVRAFSVGPGGAPVLSAPDGDTLARGFPGADLGVLGREGNWLRVRMEGWVWAPEAAGLEAGGEEGVVTEVTPEALVEDGERYRGRLVSLSLQFIALERAERVRTDFFEGEPYLLTRGEGSQGFVYVAIPPERVEAVRGLTPLERIRVVGRVRTGAAVVTGRPILDLVEFTRGGR